MKTEGQGEKRLLGIKRMAEKNRNRKDLGGKEPKELLTEECIGILGGETMDIQTHMATPQGFTMTTISEEEEELLLIEVIDRVDDIFG